MSGFSDPVTAGTVLIREAIQSPNYIAGVSGWTINRDGTASFTGLTINQGNLYLYDTTPVLRLSISSTPSPAIRIYDSSGNLRILQTGDTQGNLYFYSLNATETAPARLRCFTAAGYGRLELVGPELGAHAPGSVLIDSQDITVSSATHTGTATFQAPAGNAIVQAAGGVTIKSNTGGGGGDVDLNSQGGTTRVTGNFQILTGTGYVEGLEIFGSVHLQNNGQINLDAGSWIHRGGLANMGLLNGWTNFGGGFQNGSYTEVPEKMGAMFGVINVGGAATFFNLPAGLRPAADHTFIVGGTGGRKAQVVVQAGGGCFMQNADAGTTWISLSGIRWPMNGY